MVCANQRMLRKWDPPVILYCVERICTKLVEGDNMKIFLIIF